MKKVIPLIGMFCCLYVSAQQIDYALKNFQQAMTELRLQNLDDADSLLSLSIYLRPSAEAYLNRAQVKLAKKEYACYCSDVYNAYQLGDAQAEFIYKKRCNDYHNQVIEMNSGIKPHKLPEFDSHYGSLSTYINTYLIYPAQAKYNNIEGKVLISVIINESGKPGNVMVIKGIGHGCDEEAIRMVISMPQWIPAYIIDADGNQVAVSYKIELEIPFKKG